MDPLILFPTELAAAALVEGPRYSPAVQGHGWPPDATLAVMDLTDWFDDLHDQLRTTRLDDPAVRATLAAFLVTIFRRYDVAVDAAWLEAQLCRFVLRVRDEWPDVMSHIAAQLELEQRRLH